VTQASAAHVGNGSTAAWLLVAASVFHLLFLWAATTISVDKPWGTTGRGRRAAAFIAAAIRRVFSDRDNSSRPPSHRAVVTQADQ
ncbi:MAG: hypothetical protein WCB57_09460, partial [Pseudonocardiaceae bacterium]